MDGILERVRKDLPPSIEINREDAVEWVWDVLNKVGTRTALHRETQRFEFSDYTLRLPYWLKRIDDVRYYTNADTIADIEDDELAAEATTLPVSNIHGDEKSPSMTTSELQYLVEDGVLRINLKEGVLRMECRSIPIDQRQEPLIPEEVHFIDAAVWYIVHKYLWQGVIRNPSKYMQMFQMAKQEYLASMRIAKTRQIDTGQDALAKLNNRYLKHLPDVHKYKIRQ